MREGCSGILMMILVMTMGGGSVEASDTRDLDMAAARAAGALVARYGSEETDRIGRGLRQLRGLWRAEDGSAEDLETFAREEFIPRGERLDRTFERLEFAVERMNGYFTSLSRDLSRGVDLEIGPMLPIDERLAAYSPGAHLSEDMFASKIAFVVLLNFPLTTLEERLAGGMDWTRRQWAETRLAQSLSTRVPAEVNQAVGEALSRADSYINGYNITMHHLLTDDGRRLFPEGLRLISHWGIRDELKARYADPDGLEKQRMIAKVMERIVLQEIPASVIDNPLLDWRPFANRVSVSEVRDAEPPPGAVAQPVADREADERYRMWLSVYLAARKADPFHPDNPSLIDRRFNEDREIPEAEVRKLFDEVLGSPLGVRVARLIEERLGRKLEPFDIWYIGFKPRGKYTEEELDRATKSKYPTADAYAADIPRLLVDLGFTEERARFVADRIVVEPSRGAGHAFGAGRRDDKAHLRTRVGPDGMDYKGYNIAVHEMGHNVEQVFSMTTIDHTLLEGVPNTAFTEALAFVFQGRDLELLGLAGEEDSARSLKVLQDFWATREIAAVGLVDMAAWRWLYENPDASPAQFREAVVAAAREVWNAYFAEAFGMRDVPLFAIYSHMVDGAMYTPDYPLGHLIAFQVEEHFAKGSRPLGEEFERVCKLGNLTPDAWMRLAVGSPLSAEPMLRAAEAALETLR